MANYDIVWSKIAGVVQVLGDKLCVNSSSMSGIGCVYPLPKNAVLLVEDGDVVKCGDHLFKQEISDENKVQTSL